MKKWLALFLSVLMFVGSTITVFAAGTTQPSTHIHTITISNDNEGYEYTAYQIFTGDINDKGVLSNIQWGSGVKGVDLLNALKTTYPDVYGTCNSAAAVAEKLSDKVITMDDAKAIAFAKVASQYLNGTGVLSSRDTTKKNYVIQGLEDGYYLVINNKVPDNAPNTTIGRYILEVVRNVTVAHKGTFPRVEKKIVTTRDGKTVELDADQAPIGGTVDYKITGTVPEKIEHYSDYFYSFTDTLSKGLTYQNSTLKITVNDKDVTNKFTVVETKVTEGTKIVISIENLLSLKDTVGEITHENTKVVVTYSAEVNENALVGVTAGNPNKVYLEYDNNPNIDGYGDGQKGKTPEDVVETYVTELRIEKKDGKGKFLTGAEFTLTGTNVKNAVITREIYQKATQGQTATHYKLKDGTYTEVAPTDSTISSYESSDINQPKVYILNKTTTLVNGTKDSSNNVSITAAVDDKGIVTFTGLGAGHYTLTETKTPSGYNTINPIQFTIEFVETKDSQTNMPVYKFTARDSNDIIHNTEKQGTFFATIINVAGTVLPSTGGIGTTIFYIVGGVLFIGAAVLLVTKRRMEN